MIEEGFYNNNISNAILHKYLEMPELNGIDSLILACTHYPLIKKEIEEFYHQKIPIFDSAEVVAAKLKNILLKENLLNIKNRIGLDEFYVTDFTKHFSETAKQFYGEQINLRKVEI